jgi:hypothetical protein
MSARLAAAFTTCQMALGVMLSPQILSSLTHSAEDRSSVDASRRGPLIDGAFRPHWNRNGADMFSFANQVSDYAVLLTDLEIFRFESNQLGPSQATSNEECQNRTITFASETA